MTTIKKIAQYLYYAIDPYYKSHTDIGFENLDIAFKQHFMDRAKEIVETVLTDVKQEMQDYHTQITNEVIQRMRDGFKEHK